MKWFDNTALTIVIIGALNWLLVGYSFTGYGSFHIWKSYMVVQNYLYNYRTVRFYLISLSMEDLTDVCS